MRRKDLPREEPGLLGRSYFLGYPIGVVDKIIAIALVVAILISGAHPIDVSVVPASMLGSVAVKLLP